MSPETAYRDGTLSITAVYSAPRQTVFDAWIEIAQVQRWWGCEGTTNVVSQVEPGVGGKYLHAMTVEGAGEMTMGGTITEYSPPARLTFRMNDGPGTTVTVDFIEQGEQTEVRLVHAGLQDQFSGFIAQGWTAGFNRLEQLLAGTLVAA